jgi:hypothetical protein
MIINYLNKESKIIPVCVNTYTVTLACLYLLKNGFDHYNNEVESKEVMRIIDEHFNMEVFETLDLNDLHNSIGINAQDALSNMIDKMNYEFNL